ncbi:MAG: ATP-binding cassette domain-containing protein [Candidatus Portiera sp.]|nr:ATP-binding cassette domain-containing protein [Portiera sp.]
MNKGKQPLIPVVRCKSLHKEFVIPGQKVEVINNIDLSIDKGEKIAIMGPSGTGKTTLLTLLGGLDKPTSGSVWWDGIEIGFMSNNLLAKQRNGKIGFVYQFHHLLMEFSALENVSLPLVIGGMSPIAAKQSAADMLDAVGLGNRLQHKPGELSGGERQRVAVARALVGNPICVLMDEPTGNLDDKTASDIHKLIMLLVKKFAIALVVVTHDQKLAGLMDKCFVLNSGKLSKKRRSSK